MKKTKVNQFDKSGATMEQARQILKNGILDMSIEKLIQMVNLGLSGSVDCNAVSCGSSHYFNHMEYDTADNEEEGSIINFSFVMGKNEIAASTTIGIGLIEKISGCVNEDNPDNILNINIEMVNGAKITINVVY